MPPPPSIPDLHTRLDACMIADARRLHARLRSLDRPSRHPNTPLSNADLLSRIEQDIARSAARVEARRAAIPAITYPTDLPVAARREEIIDAIGDHQVVVLCGATGSGKTTQLPKMLLEMGRGTRGWIGHTQPRRIAARAVASRIAHELGSSLGGLVGYKVRFTEQTSERSLIKVMTDGILLAETQNDRHLAQYDTIIIDEAHERSLNIDFLLGYIRQLLPRRPDLKLIITSATIDPQRFADHFALPGAPKPPVIEVSGRTYPVEMRYRPLEAQHPDEDDLEEEQAILRAVDELSADPSGDILIFLPGEREIRETAEALRKHPLKPAHRVDVIPLFARLSTDDQQRIFDPHPGRRRIILATNVAETSLTVPGIKYVIDSGVARISRYAPRTKVQRLPIEKISRASANQRAGRCGRTEPGICIRLYSEDDFNARPEFTDPEILRTNLASVILRMKALDLGDIEQFPFLQPPSTTNIRDGYDTLLEIHALEGGGIRADLTNIGRQLSRLPIDPRIGRMLIGADAERALPEVLVIAAALATQDPRDRPIDKAAEADAAHALFREEGSDFLGQLKLWRELHKQQRDLSSNQFRKWCRQHFVSYLRFREWHDTHTQLRELMIEMGYRTGWSGSPSRTTHPDRIHRALLTGMLSSIGRKNDAAAQDVIAGEGDYDGARGIKFNIFPGSVLFKKTPKWVMAAEIVRTTRTYARTVASISPQWIEPLAQHLVKRTYAEPHWASELAQAMVYENVSLYGLEIVKRRRVPLANIDPAASRTLFIHHALVRGEYLTNARFFEANGQLIRHVRRLQERARVNDLLADAVARFGFFDKRIPSDVATGTQFEAWRRKAESREPALLVMQKQDVLAPGVTEPPAEQFPDLLTIAPHQSSSQSSSSSALLLEYKFDTGAPDDGITVIVPIDRIGELSQRRLDWMVPGVVREKVEALIRELPKSLRASFVPVPHTVAAAVARMSFNAGDFFESLTAALREITSIYVSRDQWHPEKLARHLVMNIRVIDARNKIVMQGRDLGAIRRELAGQSELLLIRLPAGEWNRSGIELWDFGTLPESVEVAQGERLLIVHPALHDENGDIAIRPFATPERARQAHAAGLRRLFFQYTRRECRSLIETMPGVERLLILGNGLESASYTGKSGKSLVEELAELTAYRAWDSVSPESSPTSPERSEGPTVRTKEAFESRLNSAWLRIGTSGTEVFTLAESILRAHLELAHLIERLEDSHTPDFAPALTDIRVQLAYLFPANFWTRTDWPWLREYPRYLSAIHRRLDRVITPPLPESIRRDSRLLNELTPWLDRLRVRVEQTSPGTRSDARSNEALILYRWMIEEYRVALWGADQRTAIAVSAKRLQEQWDKTN